MIIMQVSVWKNAGSSKIGSTYGIRIGKRNRDKYFNQEWKDIEVEIDGKIYNLSLTSSFWRDCAEVRDCKEKVIYKWVEKYKTLQWEYRKPPHVQFVYLDFRKFRLLP